MCDKPHLSGTEGTACTKNNSNRCQPENHFKEFCFRQCLKNYFENKADIILISPNYLTGCEVLDSLVKARTCMTKVNKVCDTRCFHYGQTELSVSDEENRRYLWAFSKGQDLRLQSYPQTELEKVCGIENHSFCRVEIKSREETAKMASQNYFLNTTFQTTNAKHPILNAQ